MAAGERRETGRRGKEGGGKGGRENWVIGSHFVSAVCLYKYKDLVCCALVLKASEDSINKLDFYHS